MTEPTKPNSAIVYLLLFVIGLQLIGMCALGYGFLSIQRKYNAIVAKGKQKVVDFKEAHKDEMKEIANKEVAKAKARREKMGRLVDRYLEAKVKTAENQASQPAK